ncbi:nuclear pore complex protein NUP107 isoform X1 [Lycium ferocissimum]|uniref:nuclear pore complex protein NUP107 isoform X1 n=1 Tax=Lycium ferocissimum TaxID=112874 RepID=UPI00281581CA|nr:nuclear pore complex protein NUP107 isoform X1 [Lycium ferocissimum]
METDMGTSSSYFDPENLSTRERFRRYGKRSSGSSLSPHRERSAARVSEVRSNGALFIENIKQEVESIDADVTPAGIRTASRRRPSLDSHGILDSDTDLIHRGGSLSLRTCKEEPDASQDSGDSTFTLFASLLDSALQGLISIPDLILHLENCCREVSESIRYGSNEMHRVMEDKLMRQKARILLDEAASWSLLWHLYGKGNEELPEDLIMLPTTSHLEACQFVVKNHTAQLCLRIVQWLEGLASKALDLDRKVRGSHVGTYLPSSGIWHHTQRFLKKGASNPKTINHLDFDAPTREHAQQLPDDKKQDESLLEDVWTLLRAGRLEEACSLCRSAGQSWRAATLSPFGGFDQFPSMEALVRNGKNRTLQAIELESGIGHQWRLWKWACYCASERIADQDGGKYEAAVYAAQCSNLKRILPTCMDWESACWAMAKSWLDFQVDVELARLQPGGREHFKSFEEAINRSPDFEDGASQPTVGPDSWPLQVVNQQPRHLSALLQKLHSSDTVHEIVARSCKEQQRQIEMNLMLGDIPSLLDIIWSWISPSEDDETFFRPHGDPQMMRLGAHLVLVLRYLLEDQMKDDFREKLLTVGDLILHMYTMFLFTKQHEELVGIYASQLARHRCIDLFVHMMELRLNSSVRVRYKIFLSAIEYLPFAPEDDSKGSFEEIIERVLSRSREIRVGKYDSETDVAEQHRLQSLQKAMVIQWLCFTPPSTINNSRSVSMKLLFRALMHSNVLFREFALISMWRVPAMPIGAHTLLSLLAEPLKQLSDDLVSIESHEFSENLKEFQDWSEFYSCDATYRNWLKVELENAEISPVELSDEEKQKEVIAARETLDTSLLLLQRQENLWLVPTEDHVFESDDPVFLELHATAMLCSSSGDCMAPDATLCTTLMSALYSSVSEEEVLNRQIMVNVSISSKDNYCVEVVLRCLATENDGLGPHQFHDGGILAAVLAAGFKGELVRFQAGVTMEISRLDAWYSGSDGSIEGPATYIVHGLCRRCCIPEVVLRCMQVSVSLVESGNPPNNHDEFINLVTNPETGFLGLFSQHQLQEFLLFEREYTIFKMELEESTA